MSETGRPPIFETPEQFKASADAYFDSCAQLEKRPTVNGLALALGMNSRQSLLNYAEREGFLDVVKEARTKLEAAWEDGLSGSNVAGTIFWLKNQGWSDRSEQVLSNPDGTGIFSGVEVKFVRPATD